jgi:hypothetical protein
MGLGDFLPDEASFADAEIGVSDGEFDFGDERVGINEDFGDGPVT